GGMDWLIQLAEKLLRKHPNHIIFFAPLCTFFLTFLVGTGHVVYTLMPIICDIAIQKRIRPERPCAVASVASQVGIIASPISAAVVAFSAISASNGFVISNLEIISITLPASLCGIFIASLASYKRGKDLDKDPIFQKRLQNERFRERLSVSATVLDKKIDLSSKLSVCIFLGAILVIVLFSVFQILGHNILPTYSSVQAVKGGIQSIALSGENNVAITSQELIKASKVVNGITEFVEKPLGMNIVIQIVMLTTSALIIVLCKVNPEKAVEGSVWRSGMVAVVAIYGIAWLSDTYFINYLSVIRNNLEGIVSQYPWSIAIVFFIVSVLINSQGAVVVSILPLAYKLGIPGPVLVGVLPSVYGYFFIPNYPSDIATVNFDPTGSTKIGKYLLNHSFMMPGLLSVVVSTIVGYILAMLRY
ncbi:MAG TPA: C4-dicarboxylate ABC transporter, partial [Porphyromonadaceae bacterium]|nr:C4-dicarboxylate ABC transporter [Porphyromonadaceae bacterium]